MTLFEMVVFYVIAAGFCLMLFAILASKSPEMPPEWADGDPVNYGKDQGNGSGA